MFFQQQVQNEFRESQGAAQARPAIHLA
jgi:hypothetical protein